jgi:hypothetical protein
MSAGNLVDGLFIPRSRTLKSIIIIKPSSGFSLYMKKGMCWGEAF